MTSLSIIIPTYNYANYIQQAVESVLPQLLSPDEIIVVDDGSTDDTSENLQRWKNNSEFHYICRDNAGVSAARNTGITHAKGEYIIFLDADDRLLPEALDLFRSAINENVECDLLSAGRRTVDAKGNEKEYRQPGLSRDHSRNFIDYVINKKYSLSNGAICIRREVLSSHRFPVQLRVSEDFCLYAQLLANYSACSFPEPTVLIRKHVDSLRHQVDYYVEANEMLIDILFDEDCLPERLLAYRAKFRCQRMLSLFRALYMAGKIDEAKDIYINAIRCNPANLFKLSYLRKFIRLLLAR